jgi:Uma2 family endonuclease
MIQPVLKPITLVELEAMEDAAERRYELWRGQPFAMTGGTPVHNLVTLGLYRALYPQIKAGCRIFVADVKLRLGEADDSDSAYPDLMLVCDDKPGRVQSDPLLLAEVLSDSSVRRDRVDKRAAYSALQSLQAYLILSQQDIEVDVYQRDNKWERERHEGLNSEIQLAAMGLRISLRNVYADVLADLGY